MPADAHDGAREGVIRVVLEVRISQRDGHEAHTALGWVGHGLIGRATIFNLQDGFLEIVAN